MKYDLIIPVVQADVKSFVKGIKWILNYLPIKQIVLIGSQDVKDCIPATFEGTISYMDENSLVPYEEVRQIIQDITNNDCDCVKRTGWYLQQFIKMQYANVCQDDYYLVWDSDTYPIKPVELFEKGKPVFDVKTEYHPAYFDTMHRLIPELGKEFPYSFISEHMLISCATMKELIHDIEQSPSVGEVGEVFYKKIICAIDRKELPSSGFSEFETYGTYCMIKHPELYRIRRWNSLRTANYYFDVDSFSDREAQWLGKSYDAVSFEKTTSTSNDYKKLYSNKMVQAIFSFRTAQYIERICRKLMSIKRKRNEY